MIIFITQSDLKSKRREEKRVVPSFNVIYPHIITESESNRSNLTSSLSGAVCYRESNTESKTNRMHLDYLTLDREAQDMVHSDD